MKFSIKDFFSKCDQIRRKLQIWSHLLKKLMGNFIFCAVKLLRKDFPKNNKYHKIFNLNTLKLSYNVQNIIKQMTTANAITDQN